MKKSQAVLLKGLPAIFYLPLIILDEAIEINLTLPACLVEILVYLLLYSRRDKKCAVVIFIIISTTMVADESLTHIWFHSFRHIIIEDAHHTLGIPYLLCFTE